MAVNENLLDATAACGYFAELEMPLRDGMFALLAYGLGGCIIFDDEGGGHCEYVLFGIVFDLA